MVELTKIAIRTTLRYAAQLLNPCSQLAKVYRVPAINLKILTEVSELFSDAKQSSKILTEEGSKYMI